MDDDKNLTNKQIWYTIAITLLLLVMVLSAVLFKKFSKEEFDGKGAGEARLNVLYLEGPFLSESKKNGTTYNYYVAYDDNNISHIIKLKAPTDIPVAGVDFDYSNIPDYKTVSVKGFGLRLELELRNSLYEYFGEDYVDSLSVSHDTFYLDATK